MSVAALAPKPVAPAESPQREQYRFSVAQYQQMVQTGILGPDDHVELLEGWIVQKMSRNPPHDYTLNYINLLLARLLPAIWVLRNQSALILAHSVPEPDFAIVRGPAKQYMKRHPRPADTVLLIEVADSSRMKDRRQKGLWYAEAKIPEFWLVNLVEGIVEVYTQPKGGKAPAYRQRKDYLPGDKVPLRLDAQEIAQIAVSDLCPTKA
jgi:hypothetical protein